MQEVKVTVSGVCLTRYGDAIVVGVRYQEPPLQFINANAVRPSRQRSKHCVLYVGIHSQYHCLLMFSSRQAQHQVGSVIWWHICLYHQRRRQGSERVRQTELWFHPDFSLKMLLRAASVRVARSNIKCSYALWKIHSISSQRAICKVTQYQCHYSVGCTGWSTHTSVHTHLGFSSKAGLCSPRLHQTLMERCLKVGFLTYLPFPSQRRMSSIHYKISGL